ncbi:protein DWARF 53-LIKE-like isoform X1 [Zingiber officinale]|uniref:protein DWARF 53-LIKE-like isoform X1 n=1 Tax=Zingiber officinale TaxID=94328 RepID=UPI001C4B9458|nr:protein DWARF 53-LIKE-like isoform X1 [Zingiber officinale]
MPTPVDNARACLAAEAAAALDDAAGVARRRAHVQTTSLHVVYALLASSSSSPGGRGSGGGGSPATCSILRDALSRTRSSAYSPRLQFNALELWFGLALDRLPSTSTTASRQAAEGGEEPPVSNSLMAAIKRSQANQRRNPDTFHLYQQQQSASAAGGASSFSGVKVELQHLVLAILDDPVVSRVFGDAGFRSTDVKLAILRRPSPILRSPRAARCPPLFLCNFSSGDGFEAPFTSGGLVFPFAAATQLCSDGSEENCRRLGEILTRKISGRNPVLVGVGAGEAARDFARAVDRQNWAILPAELHGIKFISIEKEVAELGSCGFEQLTIATQLEELDEKAESSGVVLNIGDLKGIVEGSAECEEQESCLVSELTRLLEEYHGRLWVMGWSATYETYMKFLSKHPMLDKDWDLQLLPITSVGTSMGGSLPRSPIFCRGIFPTAYGSKGLLSSVYPSMFHYEHCYDFDKYELEVVNSNNYPSSVDNEENGSMPSWLHKASKVNLNDGQDTAKAKDDKTVFDVKSLGLQKLWNNNCESLHSDCQKTNIEDYSTVPCSVIVSGTEKICNENMENSDVASSQKGLEISFPISVCVDKITIVNKSTTIPSLVLLGDEDSSRLPGRRSRSGQFQRDGFLSQQDDDHSSPSTATSVMTDLVLGMPHETINNSEEISGCLTSMKPQLLKESGTDLKPQQDHFKFSSCLPIVEVDMVKGNDLNFPVESFYCSAHQDSQAKGTNPLVTHPFSQISGDFISLYDKPLLISSGTWLTLGLSNYKSFCTSLMKKVGRQEEAVRAVSQAIVCYKTSERRRGAILRGDVWLSFGGPDKIGKRKMAMALAEMLFGSKETCVCIDLNCHDIIPRARTIFSQQDVKGNAHHRGKVNVDFIAQELSRKPQSVLFLENVDKADLLVQNSLSLALRTGKFPDSHGRQFSVNNVVFVLASSITQGNTSERKDYTSISEDAILDACCWQMKIHLEPSQEATHSSKTSMLSSATSPKLKSSQVYINSHLFSVSKRKLNVSDSFMTQHGTLMSAKRVNKRLFLDLNVSVEELKAHDDNFTSHESFRLETSHGWMEDLLELVDLVVDFKPIDFDALADSILQDVSKIFQSVFGSDCLLEIDPKVMEEIIAAVWSSEDKGALNNWFDQVLGKSFTEARCRYNLANHSILRLVACENAFVEKHVPGIRLPSTIILN